MFRPCEYTLPWKPVLAIPVEHTAEPALVLSFPLPPPISIRRVNDCKVEILVRKFLHSFHAVHVVKSEIKQLRLLHVVEKIYLFRHVNFLHSFICPPVGVYLFKRNIGIAV